MNHLHGTHNMTLVAISYLVAVIASYTVIGIVERVSLFEGKQRRLWVLLGSLSMGMGIWSMHFVGMLAFSLTDEVHYHLPIVGVSVLVAIVGSYVALQIVCRPRTNHMQLLGAGLSLATGIVAMHYIGMEAMQVRISYNSYYFSLSIIIAIVAAIAALWIPLYFRQRRSMMGEWLRLGSAVIMGAAIAGMHYTGMAGASFYSMDSWNQDLVVKLNNQWLAYLISTGTIITLGLSIMGIFITRRIATMSSVIREKSDEILVKNEELRDLNEHLEELVRIRTEQLAKAHQEAMEASQIKSQFLANMSHELRTPLNAIIGYSEMLQEEAEDLGEQVMKEDLIKISKAGNHLLLLINDILDLSKVEAGKMDLYMETSQLEELVADVEATIRPMVLTSGNTLTIDLTVSRLVTTDVTKLRQIMMNLLSNANKFTDKGSIVLRIEEETKGSQSGLRFVVQDTGIGMTEEQVGRLFQPFSQADPSTKRKYGGTGLGLTITQKYLQLLGGDIAVRSEFGVGTTFVCWIPQIEPQNHQEQAGFVAYSESANAQQAGLLQANNPLEHESAASLEAQPAVSVLLIDDEAFNRDLMARYLAKTGWRLAVADNGVEGLRMARQLQPSVICLDILMPSMDGWSVLTALKSDPELAHIPVVVWSMTNDKQLGYSLGASEFLMKPVHRERLINVMDKYIGSATEQPILVIEDDSTASELVTRLLTKEGYEVAEAPNGLIALDYLAQKTPALILLDLMMPQMDGFAFLEKLRLYERWKNIPVVVLTAKTLTDEDRRRLSGHVANIIEKGNYQLQSLLEEIHLRVK